MASTWLQAVSEAGCLDAEAVRSSLRQAGLDVVPPPTDGGTGPGVVVFDRVCPQLCASLRRFSGNGRQRVLAVATDPAGVGAGQTWDLLQDGASDVLVWDDDAADQVAARVRRWAAVDELVDSERVRRQLVGEGSRWRATLRRVVEIAAFTDSPVLITGESGTGKELVAHLIHELDSRLNKRDMVVMDCTTVVPTLSGSEFFGHEKGAFTGAVTSRDGAFAAANGGTLFLDEVGELPPSLQAELLRVVQEGTYKRVGSLVWQRTSFRLICATNRDLRQEEAQGRFRRDLYYRIAAATVHLPALRERPDDIVPLFQHFLATLHPGAQPPELDPVVRQLLLERDYPGNVRDLRQLAVRVSTRHVGPGPITAGDIPEEERPRRRGETPASAAAAFEVSIAQALAGGATLKGIREMAAEVAIRIALDQAAGNLHRAAHRLGVTARALQLRRAAGRLAESGVPTIDLTGNGHRPRVTAGSQRRDSEQ